MVRVLAAARNVDDDDDVGVLTSALYRVRSSFCVAGDCICFMFMRMGSTDYSVRLRRHQQLWHRA